MRLATIARHFIGELFAFGSLCLFVSACLLWAEGVAWLMGG